MAGLINFWPGCVAAQEKADTLIEKTVQIGG